LFLSFATLDAKCIHNPSPERENSAAIQSTVIDYKPARLAAMACFFDELKGDNKKPFSKSRYVYFYNSIFHVDLS